MAKKLMKGSEVLGASAIKAGCLNFFGYPITPQNEVPEYMAKELPKIPGGNFVQAESEVAAINMVYGSAASGARCMTSSSSPGIALKQEGIAYCCGAELPCVIGSVSRGGPGLGGIQPSQGDYFQATRGGGNGDYHVIVYAPSTLQELSDLTQKAFYVADKYRNPAMILIDGAVAQMMEGVEIKDLNYPKIDKSSWAMIGKHGGPRHKVITSMYLNTDELEAVNMKFQEKYDEILKNEKDAELYLVDDAEFIIAAYGTSARIVRNSINDLREKGIKIGLVRPITLWPFPDYAFDKIPDTCKGIMVLELSKGQMIQDVKLALNGRFKDVGFYGRTGGNMFDSNEARDAIEKYIKEKSILEVIK
jgi:2-oxoglutarate ferredoxin oxidoreductase subunit alpha